jgi:hypothetical protein
MKTQNGTTANIFNSPGAKASSENVNTPVIEENENQNEQTSVESNDSDDWYNESAI